jgi:hypothetical protein
MPQLCELTDDQFEEMMSIRDDLMALTGVEPKVLIDLCEVLKKRGVTVQQMADALAPPKPKPKPKRRPLCSMLIHTGHRMASPKFLTAVEERELTYAGIPLPQPRLEEVWRGCKNYCAKDMDICAVHKKTRMLQMRKAATLIQSFVRMWRAKKLVEGLKLIFGQGRNRDAFLVVLSNAREGLDETLKVKMEHRRAVKQRGYCTAELSCQMCPQSWHYLPCFIGGCKHCARSRRSY